MRTALAGALLIAPLFLLGVACSIGSLDGFSSGGLPTEGGTTTNAETSTPADAPSVETSTADATNDVEDTTVSLSIDPPAKNPGATIDLTAVGTLDWRHYTPQEVNRCSACTSLIGEADANGERFFFSDDHRTYRWTNGAPDESNNGTRRGMYIEGVGKRFSIPIQSPGGPILITAQVGVFQAAGQLKATAGTTVMQSVDIPGDSTAYGLRVHARAPKGTSIVLEWSMTALGPDRNDGGPAFDGNITWPALTIAAE